MIWYVIEFFLFDLSLQSDSKEVVGAGVCCHHQN